MTSQMHGEFAPNSLAHEAALAHPLDTVHACADIAGDMPGHWTFVLHNHGLNLSHDEIMTNSFRLAPALLTADAVGLEFATSGGYTPQAIEQLFEGVNGYLANGEYAGETDLRLLENNDAIYTIFGIVRGLHELGCKKMPVFFPVDAYADMSVESRFWHATHRVAQSSEELIEQADALASAMRDREALVLHQAHRWAHKLLPHTPELKIAIAAGSNHKLLPVAADALGAKTTTVLLDEPDKDMLVQLQQELRFATTDAVTRKRIYTEAFTQTVMLCATEGIHENTEPTQLRRAIFELWAQQLKEVENKGEGETHLTEP